jgi:hypothetical protein
VEEHTPGSGRRTARLSSALLNHPRALAQLNQVLRVQACSLSIGGAGNQEIHARARTSSVPFDRTTLNGRSLVIAFGRVRSRNGRELW